VTAALLAPHNDDETLFASFTIMRERPHVIVVLRDPQNPDVRERETAAAMMQLGHVYWEQWPFPSDVPPWPGIEQEIANLARAFDIVYAPAYNFVENGHKEGVMPPSGWGVLQHDTIGWFAHQRLGERYRPYCLYTRWNGRQRGTEVVPEHPSHVARKLRALACYESQIAQESTREWFLNEPIREYVP